MALLCALPFFLYYQLEAIFVGRVRAFQSACQLLSLLPGTGGQYLRCAFLGRVLARCHPTAVVDFGTLFSQPGARLDENVYVGPRCHLGLVHLERDVLVGPSVHIPSGGASHYFDDPERPIREQGGERRLVTVGAGAWIGSAAIVLADIGCGTVVAAGAVVTEPLPANVVAAGVPARVIRQRLARRPDSGPEEPRAHR
jgi:acetyltransferase-like isoleucine patch superfamily enzyme